jgi:hypothetical protein
MKHAQGLLPPCKPLYIPQTSAEMMILLELLGHDTPPPSKPMIPQGTTLNYLEQPSLELQQPSFGPQLLHQQMNDLSPFAYDAQQGHSGGGSSLSSFYSFPHANDGEVFLSSDPYYFSPQNSDSMVHPIMVPGTFDLSLYTASPEVVCQDAGSGDHYNI